MQFEDFARTGLLMKPVYVLGCDGDGNAMLFKVGEREMRRVGLRIKNLPGKRAEPLEKFFRGSSKRGERRGFQRLIVGP